MIGTLPTPDASKELHEEQCWYKTQHIDDEPDDDLGVGQSRSERSRDRALPVLG